MHHHRFVRLLAVVFAAVMVLGACSSSGDDTGSDGDTSSTTADTGDTGGDTGNLPAAFGGDDCLAAAAAMAAAAGGGFNPATGQFDPDATVEALQNMAAAAPDDLRADFETFADALGRYFQALLDAGVDFNDPTTFQDPAVIAALSAAAEELSSDEVTAAAERVQAGFEDLCSEYTG